MKLPNMKLWCISGEKENRLIRNYVRHTSSQERVHIKREQKTTDRTCWIVWIWPFIFVMKFRSAGDVLNFNMEQFVLMQAEKRKGCRGIEVITNDAFRNHEKFLDDSANITIWYLLLLKTKMPWPFDIVVYLGIGKRSSYRVRRLYSREIEHKDLNCPDVAGTPEVP